MSVWAVSWAYRQRLKPSGAKFVLVTLAQFADGDGYCWPGQVKLSRLTGMSERTVREHLAELERRQKLRSKVRRRGDGTYTTNGYWLLAPADELNPPSADFAGGSDQGEHDAPESDVSGSDLRQISPPEKVAGHELSVEEEDTSPPTTTNPPTPQAPTLVLVAQARPTDQPLELFKLWQEDTGHRQSVFSPKRRDLASKAILAYGFEYCALAVTGWRHSPHHRGENRNGTVYNSFDLIFRDPPHIEQFHDFAEGSIVARPTKHGMTDWRAVGARWAAQQPAEEPPAIGGLE